MIGAIVMASGFSLRMGKDKLLLPYGRQTILETVLETVIASKIDQCLVVAGDKEKLDLAQAKGCLAIINKGAEEGISSSIRCGVDFYQHYFTELKGILFVPADQVFLTTKTIDLILKKAKEDTTKIVVPYYAGQEKGSPVFFSKKFYPELLKLVKEEGGKKIMDAYSEQVLFVPIKGKRQNEDIDTQADYQRLERMGKISDK